MNELLAFLREPGVSFLVGAMLGIAWSKWLDKYTAAPKT